MKDEDFHDLLDEVNAMSNEEYDAYHKQALNIKENVEIPQDRDIKTICDEILFRVCELVGLAVKADIEDTNRKLEEQIEKMKCCCNCKSKFAVHKKCSDCKNMSEWEMME